MGRGFFALSREILHEHWAAVAIVMFLAALAVRSFFLSQCFRAVKELEGAVWREVSRRYVSRFWAGWLSLAAGTGLWVWALAFASYWPVGWVTRREGLLGGCILVLVGVLFHAKALHLATAAVLRARGEAERGL